MSAGRGAPEVATHNLGDDVAMLAEKDPVARVVLWGEFPSALINNSDRGGRFN